MVWGSRVYIPGRQAHPFPVRFDLTTTYDRELTDIPQTFFVPPEVWAAISLLLLGKVTVFPIIVGTGGGAP